jgi:hypothetical protein
MRASHRQRSLGRYATGSTTSCLYLPLFYRLAYNDNIHWTVPRLGEMFLSEQR